MAHSPDPFNDPSFLHDPAALPKRPRQHPSDVYGSARWATARDLLDVTGGAQPAQQARAGSIELRRAHLLVARDRNPDEIHALFNRSVILPPELLAEHLLVVGKTGSGKTQQLILPILSELIRDPSRSIVALDVKGDLAPTIYELARLAGRNTASDVVQLDLTDPNFSVGWNPLGPNPTDGEIQAVAHGICAASQTPRSEAFWMNACTEAITAILLALRGLPGETATLARALEILELDDAARAKFAASCPAIPALARFREFCSSGSHNALTVAADAAGRLRAFRDPDVARVTSLPELDLTHIAERPTVLILQAPEHTVDRLRPIYNLLTQQLLAHLIRTARNQPSGRTPVPVSLVLDEFTTSLGAIPEFEDRANTLRSRGVSIIAAVQSIQQIHSVYRDAAGPLLSAFGSMTFAGKLDRTDAEYASSLSGVMTASADSLRFGPRTDDGAPRDYESIHSPVPRRLLLPDEVSDNRPHVLFGCKSTMFLAGHRPFQVWLTPAYQLPMLAHILARATAGKLKKPGRRRRKMPSIRNQTRKSALGEIVKTTSSSAGDRHKEASKPPHLLEWVRIRSYPGATGEAKDLMTFLTENRLTEIDAVRTSRRIRSKRPQDILAQMKRDLDHLRRLLSPPTSDHDSPDADRSDE